MLKKSVITRSGQLWKLVIAILALLVGSFAPLYPVTSISWTAGMVIAIIGYLFGVLAIRCKDCGKMWFWEAAKDAGLYGPLFKQSACPNCGQEYGIG
jgi:hypothetical protein